MEGKHITEIRRLKSKDFEVLAGLFAKLDSDSLTKIQTLAASQRKVSEANILSVGLNVVQSVAKLTGDIYPWLADLAGMDVEEFREGDFSYPKDVIVLLWRGGQLRDFFDLSATPTGEKDGNASSTGTAGQTKKLAS